MGIKRTFFGEALEILPLSSNSILFLSSITNNSNTKNKCISLGKITLH